MTVDPSVIPGLLFLLAELVALAGVGYVIVRVALRETDHRVALAQGLVVGPAIWGVAVNLIMYLLPGMPGAIAGWVFVLALAGVLVWRSRARVIPSEAEESGILPHPRTAAGFALAALALFWIALASRQTLSIIDAANHLGLAASIRAGVFPPELPWNPGKPVPYHYGAYLLNGLLAPPSGPDLAFEHELLSAYAWISFVLVVGTALLRRGRFWLGALILTPLLLTTGAWTLSRAFELIQILVPTGLPTAGIRASLTEIYWPSAQWPETTSLAPLPNIWKSTFTMTYSLAFIVLERAARSERRTWLAVLTLAALTGFLGLTSSTLVPIVLLLWAGLEAVHLVKRRRAGSSLRSVMLRSAGGLALAALLTLAGGLSTIIVGDSTTSGLSLGWIDNVHEWRPFGTLERLGGGISLISLGPLAVAGAAALVAWRDRLVTTLFVGALILMAAVMVLRYDPAPHDLGRLAGHARNFALFALLLALNGRLASLKLLWRYSTGAVIVGVIVWPSIAATASTLQLAVSHGVELANAGTVSQARWRVVREALPVARISRPCRRFHSQQHSGRCAGILALS